ncbi:hypothetical protein [Lactobacillus crispatus]|jgi:hypothetical protein|uniref:Uncharacterized protein n=1 Tax=Lactobacillus crispatus TaxID=47770 RepID=A0ABV2BCX8_9LACO|nr:hypothetical protein [Lactobacillus crispatus]MCI6762713.1 hypothetical protein [Lactobacillus johnsonii]MCI7336323.1 hypothetical protein [Lactobacillus amylovorus]TDM96286.1 hypothetical protein CEE88_11920 [Lactobacillus crispatus]TDN02194.1 hypothetical protein CEE85_11440 [Lactobacillus crispatus]
MGKRKHVDLDNALGSYKEDIFLMLRCLGCNERTSAALMRKNKNNIFKWFGGVTRGPIVTAQWAARLILREESSNPNFLKDE